MKRALLTAAMFLLSAAPAVAAGPSPGAPGIGDPLFPGLGNGGYDVQHYDVDVRYGKAFTDTIEGNVTILARATQSLSRFNLDFAGRSVGGVVVNGAPAQWRRDGMEIVVTPRKAIKDGALFAVTVSKFVAVPTVPGDDPSSTALFVHPSGTATAPQPDLARYFLPSNDHPRDKASFDFRFDVPSNLTAVANGVPLAKWTSGGRTHSVFVQRQPMATELIQMAVGDYDITYEGFHNGVFLREVTAKPLTAQYLPLLEPTKAQLDWMRARAGAYPFDLYGSLVVDAGLGFALETQTLELIDTFWYEDYGKGTWDATLLHELSHMWFGDSVAPYSWSDLWLNEGHASWYEFTWGEENGVLEEDTTGYPDDQGYATLDELKGRLRARRRVARRERPGGQAGQRRRAVRLPALPRRRARPVRAAPEGRQRGVPEDRARVSGPLPRPLGDHRRLHRAGRAGEWPAGRRPVLARVGLRHQDAADAGPSGLDGQPRGDHAADAHRAWEAASQVTPTALVGF